MNLASNHWGVELNGAEEDKQAWHMLLKQPFEPFVEEVKHVGGDYFVLRSSTFDHVASSEHVHILAKQLFKTLNVAISKHADSGPVTDGVVIEFVQNGQPLRHLYLEAEGIAIRTRFGIAELTVTDATGKVIGPPPGPSQPQLWMRAVALNSQIGSALCYLEGTPGWFELFKVFEVVEHMPRGRISKTKVKLFTRTANAGNRHHPNKKHIPPAKPMELWQARDMMTRWVAAAIEDILAKSP